ncbi:MAG: HEPN domain-containing protein [Chloroflexi bacterium]|nr:HEPN domain-containing protein [Chloroflexota bacterium]MCH7654124.1 HEPN domain-containing protein [Chloroflexota bacterium]
MNRADLQEISNLRVEEARVLLRNGYYSGAYYLIGYAVECALKACISKQIRRYDFPNRKLVNDSYTHDLERLLGVSGLKEELDSESAGNQALEGNWSIVKDWSEQSRYRSDIPENEARDLFSAVTARRNGVLSWLMRWW